VFSSLRRTRSTIILTTHHLDEAERLTDWICVIEKGAVIVENTAAQIKERYGKGFHLEVCLREGQLTYQLVERFRAVVERAGLKAVELEHLPTQANLLVKPASKETGAIDFERAFAGVVAELE
jgi:ABC-type multidrug transport system ATPase subunit